MGRAPSGHKRDRGGKPPGVDRVSPIARAPGNAAPAKHFSGAPSRPSPSRENPLEGDAAGGRAGWGPLRERAPQPRA